MSPHPGPTPVPFSRPLDHAAVGDAGLRRTIEADAAERRALAALDGLIAIDVLRAELKISHEGRHGLKVAGEVRARIRQTCVVTLEEFDSEVVEAVEVRYLPQAEIEAEVARRAKIPSIDDEALEDLPDPIVDGRIDLGVLAAEFLALGLEPYPKKPGTTFAPPTSPPEESAPVSPFAVLGKLRS